MIDARGFSCPTPVLMVQKALQNSTPSKLEVAVDSPCAVENVTRFAQDAGYQVTAAELEDGVKLTMSK